MSQPPVAHSILRLADLAGPKASDLVTLDYEDRFLRRKMLLGTGGTRFLVDLPETVSLNHGDCFVLDDGSLIQVCAASETLCAIRGKDLVRLAWHIGNRHTPCQIETTRLLIRQDKVMADMLSRLGAELSIVTEPFMPEGGAYGLGRTHGHDHSHVHVTPKHAEAHEHDLRHDQQHAQQHDHPEHQHRQGHVGSSGRGPDDA